MLNGVLLALRLDRHYGVAVESGETTKGRAMVTLLVETTTDYLGDYETRWECEPPAKGVGFRVLAEEWDADFTVRTIKRIELA